MTFSVVIPTLNESQWIAQSIASAWQAGADEVIVADGGSQDATVEIASRLKADVVHSVVGRGHQMNRGAEAARSEILLFLHADCQLATDSGRQLVQSIENGHRFCCFQQSIDNPNWIYRLIEKGNALRAKFQRLPYGDQGIAITKKIFEQVGGFDEVPLMEDVTFARKIAPIQRPHILPGPLLISDRRWEKKGVLRQTFSNWWTMLQFRLGVSPDRLALAYNSVNRKPFSVKETNQQRAEPFSNQPGKAGGYRLSDEILSASCTESLEKEVEGNLK